MSITKSFSSLLSAVEFPQSSQVRLPDSCKELRCDLYAGHMQHNIPVSFIVFTKCFGVTKQSQTVVA